MKFFVKNKETGSRWEFEIELSNTEYKDLLNSEEWAAGPGEDILTEDWARRARGFDVFGLEDNELEEYVNELRNWFEDQGIDTDEFEFLEEESDDDTTEIELDDLDKIPEGDLDLLDEIYIEE